MTRVIYYSNSILTAEQLSQSEVYTMTDMGFIVQAALGSSDMSVTGLDCTPTSSPSLSVQIGAGALFKNTSVDITDYGPIHADSNSVIKVAVHSGSTIFNFDRTLSMGESINYLIEANFLEIDDTPEVVQYYNNSDPTSPLHGIGNSNVAQYTIRRTTVSLNKVTGQSATTGSQVTPDPTPGWLPLWVITITNGQNYIDANSITKSSSSNFAEDRLEPYALLDSPTFIGNPHAPTLISTDISNGIATTSFVHTLVDATVSNSVANLASYVSNTYATLVNLRDYAPINNAVLTGIPQAPTPVSNSNTNQIATTGFVEQQISYVAAVPPGAIFHFPSTFLPEGYLECDGSLVSRTTYAKLYQAIGTTFGQGDGIRTFQLPDLRGQFIRGWDSAGQVDPYRLMGSKQTDAMQGHYHEPLGKKTSTVQFGFNVWSAGANNHGAPTGSGSEPEATTGGPVTDSTHGTPRIAAETRPINIALVACIKT